MSNWIMVYKAFIGCHFISIYLNIPIMNLEKKQSQIFYSIYFALVILLPNKNDNKSYWQTEAVQTLITKDREITDLKQAAW